jgi:FMN phosphatase YigB (HAD superfamily)
MTEIRHIVFDIGKVLVQWERDRPYRELIPDDAERQRFLDEICTMEWHMALDEGTGIDAAIESLSENSRTRRSASSITRATGWPASPARSKARWRSWRR